MCTERNRRFLKVNSSSQVLSDTQRMFREEVPELRARLGQVLLKHFAQTGRPPRAAARFQLQYVPLGIEPQSLPLVQKLTNGNVLSEVCEEFLRITNLPFGPLKDSHLSPKGYAAPVLA